MKHAFVFGSSAFVVPNNIVSYEENGVEKEFLRVNSIYHDLPSGEPSFLDVNLDILDFDEPVSIRNNLIETGTSYTIQKERDSVKLFRSNGSLVIHVHQLDDESAMSLEHYLVAELEVNMPVAVIRITGDFKLGELHILAENEKLYVNDIGYANSALSGGSLKFSSAGVVL